MLSSDRQLTEQQKVILLLLIGKVQGNQKTSIKLQSQTVCLLKLEPK